MVLAYLNVVRVELEVILWCLKCRALPSELGAIEISIGIPIITYMLVTENGRLFDVIVL